EATGQLTLLTQRGADARAQIATGTLDLSDVRSGDSIAVNGVCLTVVALDAGGFQADLSAETLQRTTFSTLAPGSVLNLEKSVTPVTRLGGHLVSGHVDGTATLLARETIGRSLRLSLKAPDALAKYIAEKGSICVDGVSLTVNAVHGSVFEVNLVPHTLQATTLDTLAVGDSANIEVDMIARYLERLNTCR
ncbi:MAG: riboflavin synthase, partial [Gammaproteobacteria bacterium]|nr:riboflavin synthase [Gammaproteobacteria bacterium]